MMTIFWIILSCCGLALAIYKVRQFKRRGNIQEFDLESISAQLVFLTHECVVVNYDGPNRISVNIVGHVSPEKMEEVRAIICAHIPSTVTVDIHTR
jgi:hypothetical protein